MGWNYIVIACLTLATAGSLTGISAGEVAGIKGDYSHYADLLAGILLIREGGIEEAALALPRLHNQTAGHITIREFFKKGKKAHESQKEANDALNEKLEKLNLKFSKLPPGFEDKVNKPRSKLKKKAQDLEAAIDDNLSDQLSIVSKENLQKINDELGSSLANGELTPVDISPSKKFVNSAAVISNEITNLQAQVQGVNFNPCVFSTSIQSMSASVNGISFSPRLIDIEPQAVVASATGINIQPALMVVTPVGAGVQPFGVAVTPTLISVTPIGAYVQPYGICIQPYLFQHSPIGVQTAPIGLDVSGQPANDISYSGR